ncbi:MAG: hypothetical protein WCO35_03585 [Candidatus Nomurabacteria bacterium]
MNNNIENFDRDELLDIKSPYIKNNIYGIDEVRERIAKRASGEHEYNVDNFLSVNKELEKGGSDTLLRQKITNVSKKIVGEEIKKFAEIAGREISNEFENLENRLGIKLKENLDTKINSEILKLNTLLADMESRIKDLEIYSFTKEKMIPEKEEIVEEYQNEDYVFVLNENKKTEIKKEEEIVNIIPEVIEEEIIPIEIKIQKEKKITPNKEEESKEEIQIKEDSRRNKYKNLANREEEEKYINEQIKNISSQFEKEGAFFKKNTFTSKIKDLNVEEFLNEPEDIDIDKKDKEKIYEILITLMDSLNIDPNENDDIENFLKKAFQKEYQLKN